MNEIIEAALVALLTRVEGWKPEEVKVFIAQIRTDMKKKSAHMMQELYVHRCHHSLEILMTDSTPSHCVWAQKPETAPQPATS
jgi:hypothetical protein